MPKERQPVGKIIIGDSRNMIEIEDQSVDLIVTSPPYWHLKDYGVPGQIGYGQSLHEYLQDLSRVWKESFRVLRPGRRLCVNIGDQFARALIYGRYKVIPLHAEIIAQCETIGFDYMGAIIWQKKTTMRTTGGAVVMGSFPYPPNGVVELDYEYILIFRKPGKAGPFPKEQKEASRLTRDEWKRFFTGHWNFGGERQVLHEAMFPEELPGRLIRMFSLVGETVLDPFVGSGTTVKVALQLQRNAIGYEIQPEFLPVIRQKLSTLQSNIFGGAQIIFTERSQAVPPVEPPEKYQPRVQDARPLIDPKELRLEDDRTYRVEKIIDEQTLLMDTGLKVRLAGIEIPGEKKAATLAYLRKYLLGKRVRLRFEGSEPGEEGVVLAYVYLTNKLFVNRKMIEMGLANADRSQPHRLRNRFLEAERSA